MVFQHCFLVFPSVFLFLVFFFSCFVVVFGILLMLIVLFCRMRINILLSFFSVCLLLCCFSHMLELNSRAIVQEMS